MNDKAILTSHLRQLLAHRLERGAYYFDLEATECPQVDLILGAVCYAGKAAHHTGAWLEGAGNSDPSPVEVIQAAANQAAAEIKQLEAKIERLWAENAAAAQAGFEVAVTWHGRTERAEERLKAVVQIVAQREHYVDQALVKDVMAAACYVRCEQCDGSGCWHDDQEDWYPRDCVNGWRPSDG